jgi:hypothetical protein
MSQVAVLSYSDSLEAEGRLFDAIDALVAANRECPSAEVEQRLVRLRYEAFNLLGHDSGHQSWPPEARDPFPAVSARAPELELRELTPETLAGGIVHHGSVLVRGLISSDQAAALVDAIQRAFQSREAREQGVGSEEDAPWYEPFPPGMVHSKKFARRNFIRSVDSPRALFVLLETFHEIGLDRLIAQHLGERPALSANKCSLRCVSPEGGQTDFHQDGAFLGDSVRALNVWLALSNCGGDADARGLDFVPRRLDGVLNTETSDSIFDWTVSESTAERVADGNIASPEFAPGDALLFDELLLHRTGALGGRTRDRYAIESWFFAPSSYPDGHVPVIV